MATLITYWIELDTSKVLPVNPAIVKTYVISELLLALLGFHIKIK